MRFKHHGDLPCLRAGAFLKHGNLPAERILGESLSHYDVQTVYVNISAERLLQLDEEVNDNTLLCCAAAKDSIHACMRPSSAMDCYNSVLTCPWFLVLEGLASVLGPWSRNWPSANDSMQSQQKIASMRASMVMPEPCGMREPTMQESWNQLTRTNTPEPSPADQ